MFTTEYSELDGLEFYSKQAAMDQLQRFIEIHMWDYCHKYGEPGYRLEGDQQVIVFGDYWCRCKQNPHIGQPGRYGRRDELVKPDDLHSYDAHFPLLWARWEEIASFEWDDEWQIDYECDKAYRTSGDSYSWQPSIIWNDDTGDYMTPDDDIETWIEWATAEPTQRSPRSKPKGSSRTMARMRTAGTPVRTTTRR
jgi:hypothetical protein